MDETELPKDESAGMQQVEGQVGGQDAVPDGPGQSAPGGPGHSTPWARKLLLGLLGAVIFGVVGYLIVPQSAKSTLKGVDQTLQQTRAQLAMAQAAQRKLAVEYRKVSDELAEAQRRIETLTESEKAARSKVMAAEKFIADLSAKLASARRESRPLREQLAAARQAADELRMELESHKSRLQQLQEQLQQVTAQRQKLASARAKLASEKAKLERTLRQEQRDKARLVELLAVLEVGQPGKPPSLSGQPGEMPITVKELEYWMGQPSMMVQQGDRLTMRWGSRHVARAVSGLVISIDGKPATRALLASVAPVAPIAASLSGPWRLSAGQPVRYSQLVALFGRPAGTSGTGRKFTAWWHVGAWGRPAVAQVADGVVELFDGRPVDGEALCRLVPHRPEAYSRPDRAALAAAQQCYKQAVELIAQHLRREAEVRAKDGWHLKQWHLADFDSVGTWIAPTRVPVEGMTLRAALSCTWAAEDGRVERQRRYVVVTVSTGTSRAQQEDFAIFAPRN